jgi:DNA-binding transcriptional ArsR family regulator
MSERVRQLTTPSEMRALTHPLRLQLLGSLRREGPGTASTLAAALDVSPALASYHLRQLARHRFVEEAPELARTGRERWWRAAQDMTSFATADFLDTPERAAAVQALEAELFRRYHQALVEHLQDAPGFGPEWVEAADHSDYHLTLDAAGLRSLSRELADVVQRYHRDPPAPTGPTEQVVVILHSFPRRRAR